MGANLYELRQQAKEYSESLANAHSLDETMKDDIFIQHLAYLINESQRKTIDVEIQMTFKASLDAEIKRCEEMISHYSSSDEEEYRRYYSGVKWGLELAKIKFGAL